MVCGSDIDEGCGVVYAAEAVEGVVFAGVAEAHVGMEKAVAAVAVDDEGVAAAGVYHGQAFVELLTQEVAPLVVCVFVAWHELDVLIVAEEVYKG